MTSEIFYIPNPINNTTQGGEREGWLGGSDRESSPRPGQVCGVVLTRRPIIVQEGGYRAR